MNKHNPKKLSNIISSFSQNNNIIKFATHDWDFGRGEKTFSTIEEFIKQLKEEWNKHSAEIKELKPSIYEKYETFLFDKENQPWGEYRLKWGWSSEGVEEEYPKGTVLPREYRKEIDGKAVDRFKDVIEVFKKEIYLPFDERELRMLIRSVKKKITRNLISFPNIQSVEISTDVVAFKNALSLMIKDFEDVSQKYTIEVNSKKDYQKREFVMYISLITEDTTDSIELESTKRKEKFDKIKNELISVCDWAISIENNGKKEQKTLLGREIEIPDDEIPGAITHILKFYF